MVALVDAVEDVADIFLDAGRRNAVLGVIGFLLLAAAIGFRHRPLHRAGDMVGIENDLAVDVTRSTPNRLD